jgi:hypothetical protein
VHERLSQIMTARGLPEPQFSGTNTADQLALVRNREYQVQEAAEMSPTLDPAVRASRAAARRAAVEARFEQRPGYGWFDRSVWRAATWGPLIALVASWHTLDPWLRPVLGTIYGLLSALVLIAVKVPYPTRYELALDDDGIELVVSNSRTRYPWHRIKEARLVLGDSRAGRPNHVLVLELQSGTLPPSSYFLAPVPRWHRALSGIRFAEIARLSAGEDDIERALGRFARGCWTPASGINLTGNTTEFSTRRRRLATASAALLTLGISPLLLFGGLLYGHVPVGTLAFVLIWAGLISIPGLITATWARHPGHLKLDDQGIEIALGSRISQIAWHDIEQVRTTGWLPEISGDRLLVVRPWPSSAPPPTRPALPWASRRARIAVLCPIQIFAANQSDIFEGLTRFAGSAWKAGAGLYAPPDETAGRMRFAGRLAGPYALLGAVAGYIAERLLNALVGLMRVPASAASLATPFSLSILIVDISLIVAGALLARDRFSLIVDGSGLTLKIGRSPAFIPWEDIDHVAIIRSSRSADGLVQTPWSSQSSSNSLKRKKKPRKTVKDREYLFAWITPESRFPRRWWQILGLMRPGLGGVSIMQLDAWPARLFTTRAELEQALIRYGGSRFASDQDALGI